MSKRYFINRLVNLVPKNMLDEDLHAAFHRVINHEISDDNINVLVDIFNNTIQKYKASGGRCKTWNLRIYKHENNNNYESIFFNVSETCKLLLEEIKGEITPF